MRAMLREVRAIGARRRALVVLMALVASFAAMSVVAPALASAHAAGHGAKPAKKAKKEKPCRKKCKLEKLERLEKEQKELSEQVGQKDKEIQQKNKELTESKARGEKEAEERLRSEVEAKEKELQAKEAELKKHEEELPQAEKEKLEREAKETAQKELEEYEATHQAWLPFRHCPVNNGGTSACFWGQSGPESEFTAGKVHVPLVLPITIWGGLEINEETEELTTIGPEDGAPTLTPVAQPGPALNKDVDAELLSPAEKELYYRAHPVRQEQTTVTIELAGPPVEMKISTNNLINENGTALALPTKVKLSNPFFANDCYVGSDEHPIWIYLTTGSSGSFHGSAGSFGTEQGGEILVIEDNRLVENTFEAPGVEGCGGDSSVDEAMDAALGLPSLEPGSNVAVIQGTLAVSSVEAVKREAPGLF